MQPHPIGNHLCSDTTAVSSSVIPAFSNMLAKKLAAAEPTLCFPVSLTLRHTGKKEDLKVVLSVESWITIRIKDLQFFKNNYASAGARNVSIILPKYSLSARLILTFYFSVHLNVLFIFRDVNLKSGCIKMIILRPLLVPLHLLYACVSVVCIG